MTGKHDPSTFAATGRLGVYPVDETYTAPDETHGLNNNPSVLFSRRENYFSMRKLCLLLSLFLPFLGQPAAFAQASPFNLNIFKTQSFTASGQTGAVIQLNGLTPGQSTVGSSYASGTITVGGTAITTVSFQVMGSSDNGATFYVLPVFSVASPTSPPVTTVTATAAGLYQFSLAGLSHVKFVTTGTFTATSVTLTLTGSPNASISRNGSGGVMTLTSPNSTVAIGGTTTARTLQVNPNLILDSLAFTTEDVGSIFPNGSGIAEDATLGLLLHGVGGLHMSTDGGVGVDITGTDGTNAGNFSLLSGAGAPDSIYEMKNGSSAGFIRTTTQTAEFLDSGNTRETQLGTAPVTSGVVPTLVPKVAIGNVTTTITNTNIKLVGAVTGTSLNGVAAIGSSATTDLGAEANAAFTACGNSCTVAIRPGAYPSLTTISMTHPGQSLEGLGPKGAVTVNYTGSSDGVLFQLDPFQGFNAGTIKNVIIHGTSSGAAGIHTGNMVGSHLQDLNVTGFTAGSCILIENKLDSASRAGWYERNLWDGVQVGSNFGDPTNDCLYQVRAVNNGGTNSLEYNRFNDLKISVNPGQKGLYLDGSIGTVILTNSEVHMTCNVNSGNTQTGAKPECVTVTNNSRIQGSTLELKGENICIAGMTCDQTTGYGLHVISGGRMNSNGGSETYDRLSFSKLGIVDDNTDPSFQGLLFAVDQNTKRVPIIADGQIVIAAGSNLSGLFLLQWNSPNRQHDILVDIDTLRFDGSYFMSTLSNHTFSGQSVLSGLTVVKDSNSYVQLLATIGNRNDPSNNSGYMAVTYLGNNGNIQPSTNNVIPTLLTGATPGTTTMTAFGSTMDNNGNVAYLGKVAAANLDGVIGAVTPQTGAFSSVNVGQLYLVPNTGSAGGFVTGYGINCQWDVTNSLWRFKTDTVNNGGTCILGTNNAGYSVYTVPTNGTPASDQTLTNAALLASVKITYDATGKITTPAGASFGGAIQIRGTAQIFSVQYLNATISTASLAANSCATFTPTVTGLGTTDNISQLIPPGNTQVTGIISNAWVSAANTLTIQFCNVTAGALTPTTGTYKLSAMH